MKILITLDGSEFAEAILEPIGKLVATPGVEIHLIEVVRPSESSIGLIRQPTSDPHSLDMMRTGEFSSHAAQGTWAETRLQADERSRQTAEDYLRHVSTRFFSDNAIREVVLGEDAAEAILGYARREEIDLIAIATHGRTGLPRLLMGSVAGSLLKAHVAPLFIVRPDGLGTRNPDAMV